MLYLSEEDVKELLPMHEAIGLMRGAFEALAQGRAINQPRRRLILDTGAMLHSMAGSYGTISGPSSIPLIPNTERTFSSCCYDAHNANPWLGWRQIIWGRFAPAPRVGTRPIYWQIRKPKPSA